MARRRPREKPQRKQEHLDERKEIADAWRKKPGTHFVDGIDLIMDNKKWPCPITPAGKDHVQSSRVRWHLRTPDEGVEPGFTKPNTRKHRQNVGGNLLVCAGIIKNRVRLWHYLPDQKWNAEIAAKTYSGPIIKALKRNHGAKRFYKVLEDNDPTGYKSKKAVDEKRKLSIKAVQFPRYSPDLNPLDFFLWNEVWACRAVGWAA